jgi:RNA polymerase sigma factor (sigma-70 family)
MLRGVPLTFVCAESACADARLEHLTDDFLVRARPAVGHCCRRKAHIRALQVQPNALAQLCDVALDVGMAGDHFFGLHSKAPVRLSALGDERRSDDGFSDATAAPDLASSYNGLVDAAERDAPLALLIENHRAFLRYLEGRVGDRALAEDILQEAFAKVVTRPEQAPDDEGIVPWFYRTLRNAAVDQFRRRGAANRAYEAFARELETHDAATDEIEGEICACVSRLARTLKPEYAEALQVIEVGGTPVKAFAEQRGLSPGNAAVRVFRAREALKKRVTQSCGACAEHGCLNCTCKRA